MVLPAIAAYYRGMKLREMVLVVLGFCLVWTGLSPSGIAQVEDDSEVIADIRGMTISRGELEGVVEQELGELEKESLLFAANQERRKYDLLEKQLNTMMSEELFRLEAADRGIPQDELLEQEVYSKTEPPTEQDVETYYEANRSRIREPKAQVLSRIRRFLAETKMDEAQESFLDQMKKKYQAEVAFGPYRLEIATAGHPFLGTADAPVTLVEFSDFECPYCLAMYSTLKILQRDYGEKVRVVFRQFPLNGIHPHAQKAAEASLCANDQGKFWELHDLMFEGQDKLEVSGLESKVESLGLDLARFQNCLSDERYAAQVKEDVIAGTAVGVTGTPAIFVNGRPLLGNVPYEEIAEIVDEELESFGGTQ
jgi:protein-disulfide isomerase